MNPKEIKMAKPPGLYANIAKKRARIKAGSGEKMRSVGDKGAPTAQNFKDAAKTAKMAKIVKIVKHNKNVKNVSC